MMKNDLYPSFNNPFLIRTTRPIPEEMAVIGAGNIGPDIAYSLRTGLPDKKLYLVDVIEDPLKKAKERFEGYARKGVEKKKLRPEQVEPILGNIEYTTDYNKLKNCDLVIEAAPESMELKESIFREVDAAGHRSAGEIQGPAGDTVIQRHRDPVRAENLARAYLGLRERVFRSLLRTRGGRRPGTPRAHASQAVEPRRSHQRIRRLAYAPRHPRGRAQRPRTAGILEDPHADRSGVRAALRLGAIPVS